MICNSIVLIKPFDRLKVTKSIYKKGKGFAFIMVIGMSVRVFCFSKMYREQKLFIIDKPIAP